MRASEVSGSEATPDSPVNSDFYVARVASDAPTEHMIGSSDARRQKAAHAGSTQPGWPWKRLEPWERSRAARRLIPVPPAGVALEAAWKLPGSAWERSRAAWRPIPVPPAGVALEAAWELLSPPHLKTNRLRAPRARSRAPRLGALDCIVHDDQGAFFVARGRSRGVRGGSLFASAKGPRGFPSTEKEKRA